MSRYLVTGGAGFIGSHLVDRLIDEGHQVIVIDNECAQTNEEFYWNENASNYKYDICDYEQMFPLFEGVDVVFHLAAESRIQPAIKNPIKAARTNVVGTCNVLQCARKQGVRRVIYSSTSSAYGVANQPPLTEDMPKDCLNPYSVTKCAGEDLCAMYTRLYGLETVIFRYFNVYGERQPVRGQYAPVVGIFQRQVKNGEPMTIVGDGEQRRDYTYVLDVVQANVLASVCTKKMIVGNIINIGMGENYSVLELAGMVGDDVVHIPPRLGEARITLANISRAREWLAFEPQMQLPRWIEQKKEEK